MPFKPQAREMTLWSLRILYAKEEGQGGWVSQLTVLFSVPLVSELLSLFPASYYFFMLVHSQPTFLSLHLQ